jgi:hypothetical protein
MSASFRHIEVTRNNDAVTVHFRRSRMSQEVSTKHRGAETALLSRT